MKLRGQLATIFVLGGLLGSVPAFATETITYTYDARGRLVKVVHTGTVNNNNQVCYKYDKADNRANVQVNVGSLPACP
jgi:YD repeat-containing protein